MTKRRVKSGTTMTRSFCSCGGLTLVFLLCCCRLSPASSSTSSSTAETPQHVRGGGGGSSSNKGSKQSFVARLPGFHGPLPFKLQTGYVEVDESNGVELFYYFIQSERSPGEDPLLLWLTGGPGCSAFSGLVYEIGPLSFDVGGYVDGLPKLLYKPDSWTKVSNVIFLDSPIGTGFSYSRTEEGYRSSDAKAVDQILTFLTKWLVKHPDFQSNPFYIAGDSYSGMIVPTVTYEIVRRKEVGNEVALNLQGYLVGNPVTDVNFDDPSKIPFAHGMGLISDKIYEDYKKNCNVEDKSQKTSQCTNTLDAIDECVKDICTNHILEPLCTFASPHPYNKLKLNSRIEEMLQFQDYTRDLHLSEISSKCRTSEYEISRIWANNNTVRDALGIHKGTVSSWIRCNYDILYTVDIKSSVKYHLEVTSRGYRSLVYSGDHDMIIPFIGTQEWIRSLNFSIVDDWRPWYVDGQVAGFTRSYSNNLTFATVKGGGHTAPEYMPRQCYAMFARWASGDPL